MGLAIRSHILLSWSVLINLAHTSIYPFIRTLTTDIETCLRILFRLCLVTILESAVPSTHSLPSIRSILNRGHFNEILNIQAVLFCQILNALFKLFCLIAL